LVAQLVRLLVALTGSGKLFRRQMINDNILGDKYRGARFNKKPLSSVLLSEASVILRAVFGFELLQMIKLDEKAKKSMVAPSSAQQSAAAKKAKGKKSSSSSGSRSVQLQPGVYMIINGLPTEQRQALQIEPNCQYDAEELGLLFIVVSMIYLNKNSLKETVLFDHLAQLGIERTHPFSALPSRWQILISEDFVRRDYIKWALEEKKSSVPSAQRERIYSLGTRGMMSFTKQQVYQFVAQCMGRQLDQLTLDEIQAEQARAASSSDVSDESSSDYSSSSDDDDVIVEHRGGIRSQQVSTYARPRKRSQPTSSTQTTTTTTRNSKRSRY